MTIKAYSFFLAFGVTTGVLLATSPAGAGEKRCSDLGSDCICSEPLNTNTVDGGQSWAHDIYLDPDDSPNATECEGETGDGKALTDVTQGFRAVNVSGQPLPPGHSLSWVLRKDGGGVSVLRGPDIDEPSNTTYCNRSYQRWDPASAIPGAGSATANSQYKVSNMGGKDPNGNHNPFQLAVVQTGSIFVRADSNWFNCPVDFQGFSNGQQNCTNNFCRFETCLDHKINGKAQFRARLTYLAPHPQAGQSFVITKPECLIAQSRMTFQDANDPMGWYAQELSGPSIRYATHALTAKHTPQDSSWWPGPACEVEGGCSGAPPSPPLSPPEPPYLFP